MSFLVPVSKNLSMTLNDGMLYNQNLKLHLSKIPEQQKLIFLIFSPLSHFFLNGTFIPFCLFILRFRNLFFSKVQTYLSKNQSSLTRHQKFIVWLHPLEGYIPALLQLFCPFLPQPPPWKSRFCRSKGHARPSPVTSPSFLDHFFQPSVLCPNSFVPTPGLVWPFSPGSFSQGGSHDVCTHRSGGWLRGSNLHRCVEQAYIGTGMFIYTFINTSMFNSRAKSGKRSRIWLASYYHDHEFWPRFSFENWPPRLFCTYVQIQGIKHFVQDSVQFICNLSYLGILCVGLCLYCCPRSHKLRAGLFRDTSWQLLFFLISLQVTDIFFSNMAKNFSQRYSRLLPPHSRSSSLHCGTKLNSNEL